MIGDHLPRKRYWDSIDKIHLVMAILATLALLVLVLTHHEPVDREPGECDTTTVCVP